MPTNLKMVDDLGHVLAQIADLEKKADALKDALREAGPGAYEGKLFRATVGEDGESTKYDVKALVAKLIALKQRRFVKSVAEVVPRQGSVRCVAKTGKELKEAA